MRSLSRAGLAAITSATMAIATFPIIVFSVLAADLIEEFSVTRFQVGILVTATGLTGAVVAPTIGRVTDRVGAVTSTRAVLALGTATLLGLAVSPSYLMLVAASLLTGVPNGWCNPATNALIVENVPIGKRGVVTGIKQSGVQIGTFLGGLLLPPLAALWHWRLAVASFVVIPIAALAGLGGHRDRDRATREHHEGKGPLPTSVKWVALYGTLSGLASSAMFGFFPLFAEEDQLWSPWAAGFTIAVIGLTGIAARITWPTASERRMGHGPTLRLLASLSSASALLLALAAADVAPSWVLVPAALLLGAGAIAWNAVGMLAVMDFTPASLVGRGTGLVLFGFLLGIAAGAPLLGLSVDLTGTYLPGWLAAAALLAVCAAIARRIP
ncbi:MAG: MFS transporter, partial [Acidimicrobiia bacterium]